MLTPQTLLALTLFAFVSSVTPGPNNLMVMASGTNFGFARSLPHMLGVVIGFVVMLLAIGFGLGALLQAAPGAMTILQVVSVGYLLYLAGRIATAAPPADDKPAAGRPLSFWQAAAFQWINPKAWTMSLTAMAIYVPANDAVIGVLLVTFVFFAVGVPTVALWTAGGVQLRKLLHRPLALRTFNVTAAVLLVASLYPLLGGPTPATERPGIAEGR
jgi:threonine/homoserine/homoserine lactone efflux protein